MKNLGWHCFFALLLGDLVALAMLKMHVALNIVIAIAGLVFVILAAVMFFAGSSRERSRKRERETAAKLAELENKAKEEEAPKPETTAAPDEPAK